ncbi:hypothetical protein PPERSA_04353 [Pseudocohnilembus persalinus]|uniref:Uncharacterized protein n=1 Tax=Pseudocohnilembus persalinus TaxID=266149 RepID=A0A0V0QR96_PSEPJ|nr:hypothetical protein PPERSA_04353 [Pseudocohnilembus persalinus]|eukprot:KRX04538.1 hypothetical protein PPERSA_04353 [Pseudocohnilembus persalinus]
MSEFQNRSKNQYNTPDPYVKNQYRSPQFYNTNQYTQIGTEQQQYQQKIQNSQAQPYDQYRNQAQFSASPQIPQTNQSYMKYPYKYQQDNTYIQTNQSQYDSIQRESYPNKSLNSQVFSKHIFNSPARDDIYQQTYQPYKKNLQIMSETRPRYENYNNNYYQQISQQKQEQQQYQNYQKQQNNQQLDQFKSPEKNFNQYLIEKNFEKKILNPEQQDLQRYYQSVQDNIRSRGINKYNQQVEYPEYLENLNEHYFQIPQVQQYPERNLEESKFQEPGQNSQNQKIGPIYELEEKSDKKFDKNDEYFSFMNNLNQQSKQKDNNQLQKNSNDNNHKQIENSQLQSQIPFEIKDSQNSQFDSQNFNENLINQKLENKLKLQALLKETDVLLQSEEYNSVRSLSSSPVKYRQKQSEGPEFINISSPENPKRKRYYELLQQKNQVELQLKNEKDSQKLQVLKDAIKYLEEELGKLGEWKNQQSPHFYSQNNFYRKSDKSSYKYDQNDDFQLQQQQEQQQEQQQNQSNDEKTNLSQKQSDEIQYIRQFGLNPEKTSSRTVSPSVKKTQETNKPQNQYSLLESEQQGQQQLIKLSQNKELEKTGQINDLNVQQQDSQSQYNQTRIVADQNTQSQNQPKENQILDKIVQSYNESIKNNAQNQQPGLINNIQQSQHISESNDDQGIENKQKLQENIVRSYNNSLQQQQFQQKHNLQLNGIIDNNVIQPAFPYNQNQNDQQISQQLLDVIDNNIVQPYIQPWQQENNDKQAITNNKNDIQQYRNNPQLYEQNQQSQDITDYQENKIIQDNIEKQQESKQTLDDKIQNLNKDDRNQNDQLLFDQNTQLDENQNLQVQLDQQLQQRQGYKNIIETQLNQQQEQQQKQQQQVYDQNDKSLNIQQQDLKDRLDKLEKLQYENQKKHRELGQIQQNLKDNEENLNVSFGPEKKILIKNKKNLQQMQQQKEQKILNMKRLNEELENQEGKMKILKETIEFLAKLAAQNIEGLERNLEKKEII